jgi:hypothetical protein
MNSIIGLLTPVVKTSKKRNGQSKAELARKIYDEMLSSSPIRPSRKEIIKRFMDEAGLTANGANTYLYNMDKKTKLDQQAKG